MAFKLLTRLAESEDPLGMNASATANSSLESVMSESSASLSPEKQQQLINDGESNHDNDENNGYFIEVTAFEIVFTSNIFASRVYICEC